MKLQQQQYSIPISLEAGIRSKKTYHLNLNQYNKWYFQEKNQIKKLFKVKVAKAIRALKKVTKPCKITYVIYFYNKRLFDIDNVGCVLTKFNNDALVELGILTDDNYTMIPELVYKFGGVDKDNPRCEVIIEEIV